MFVFSVPPPPEDVTASAKCDSESGDCDVEVSWSTPELIPDKYVIYMFTLDQDGSNVINTTVSGVSSYLI